MVEENVPGIQIEEYEESKGSLSNRSNEAREEVSSEYSDISQEAKVYEEAIIYIAKTNIEKIGGSKLPNAFENNQKDNRVSTPDGHFYLKVGVSSAEQLILGSSFKEGVRHLEPNSRLLIEVKTKLPRDIGKLGKQIKKSYNQLEKLYKEYNLSSVEITNSSIGNYLIVFNGTDPRECKKYFKVLKGKLPGKIWKIIGILYCANTLAKQLKKEISVKKKETYENEIKEDMKEERKLLFEERKQLTEERKQLTDTKMQFAKQMEEDRKLLFEERKQFNKEFAKQMEEDRKLLFEERKQFNKERKQFNEERNQFYSNRRGKKKQQYWKKVSN